MSKLPASADPGVKHRTMHLPSQATGNLTFGGERPFAVSGEGEWVSECGVGCLSESVRG